MPYNHSGEIGDIRKHLPSEGLTMFICPKCKAKMDLPYCSCGYTVQCENSIYQLSDMPNIIIDGDGDKYIGYEFIGESYSGNRKYLIEERDLLFAKEISEQTKDEFFLDLACGDGCFTVPCASFGIKIIAGDISNTMLSILQLKAKHNHISLDNVTLCRINALDIPIADNSVGSVVANSVLHLISNPQKVVSEIYRVLKKGGKFICKDDRPGINFNNTLDNARYNEIVNYLYSEYWNKLKSNNVQPKKYSWKFDREAICDKLFHCREEKHVKRGNAYEIPLKDGFLPRFMGRGFSDQVDVTKNLHDTVIIELLTDAKNKYGEQFLDVSLKGVEEDLLITIYTK